MPERSSSEKSTEERREESDSSESSYDAPGYKRTRERSRGATGEGLDDFEEIKREKGKIDAAFAKEENKDGYLKKSWKAVDKAAFETLKGTAGGVAGVGGWAIKETVSTAWKETKMISNILWRMLRGKEQPSFKEIWREFFSNKEDKK